MAEVLDCGGLFKDYALHKVQSLSEDIAKMDVLSLNYIGCPNFVFIIWTLMIKDTAKGFC